MADIQQRSSEVRLSSLAGNVRVGSIVFKKSLFADDGKFSGPLVTRCDVWDRIKYRNGRWRSSRF
jgi:hypothetical protein